MRAALDLALLTLSLVLALAWAGCVPDQQCFNDDDCGIGRCVDAECVECAGDNDCDDDEECDDGECEEIDEGEEGEGEASEGEGEGEGEGSEGEGEGSEGEGEGEGFEGEGEGDETFECGPFWICEADERCLSLDDDTDRACFETCDLGDACTNAWGLTGACEPVDGVNVCVATAPADGACGSFGNARCDDGETCVKTNDIVSSCFQACDPDDHACPGDRVCYTAATAPGALICLQERAVGETCGIEDDGAFTYCDPAVAFCDYFESLLGTCTVEGSEGEGEGEGPIFPGEGEGEGSEGEGENEPEEECFSDIDCDVLSYTTGPCETEEDCDDTQSMGSLNHCAESPQGGRCVLKSLTDPRCEDLPESFPLEVAGGVSTEGVAILFCAAVGSECVDGQCQGPSF